MSGIRDIALALRFALELAAIVAVAWWGFTLDAPVAVRVIAGIAAPAIVIVVWGAVVAPQARLVVPVWLREVVEAIVWVAAAAALLAVGATGLAVVFAGLVIADRVVLRATAGRPSRLEAGALGSNRDYVEQCD